MVTRQNRNRPKANLELMRADYDEDKGRQFKELEQRTKPRPRTTPGRPIRNTAIQDAALQYLQDGFVPIPISSEKKPPAGFSWKEFQDRRPTEDEITAWYQRWPNAGVAIVCGWDGLAVIDVDQAALTPYLTDLGKATRVVQTPRGGVHIYFRSPLPSKSGPVFAGLVDVKADGGYVVAPPTPGYEVLCDAPVGGITCSARALTAKLIPAIIRNVPALQEELGHFVADEETKKKRTVGLMPAVTRLVEGARNSTLTSRAGSMRRNGKTPDEIEAQLIEINVAQCSPPLDDDEVHQIAYSVGQYPPGPKHLNDAGNGERFVDLHGTDTRFCYEQRKWIVWRGTHWERDGGALIEGFAAQTARSIYGEAERADSKEERESLARWAHVSESWDKRQAMIKSAQNLVPIARSQLDTDNWLLNCANGTVDLRTGELRPHSQEDFITRLLPTRYSPDAEAPLWQGFLERVVPDEDIRLFLQRAVGYSLTGEISEQVLFFLHGLGQNGKSTFLDTLHKLLPGYAQMAAPGLLFASKQERHATERADLFGARIVISEEAGRGRRFNEEFIKQQTGGTDLKARMMYQDFWEFAPTHKLWIGANDKPEIQGLDYAIWRRIMLVPFEVTIPEEERDYLLIEKLRGEGEGILAWAVAGCLEWRRNGLCVPEAVKAATAEYRTESDPLARFLREECTQNPGDSVRAEEFYNAWAAWATRQGITERDPEWLSSTRFGKLMGDRFKKEHVRSGTFYYGVGLAE